LLSFLGGPAPPSTLHVTNINRKRAKNTTAITVHGGSER
jgi:hypothetical protein